MILVVMIFCTCLGSGVSAVTPNADPFPIGFFWPPSQENTSFSAYETIKQMNNTFVLMGNGIDNYTENDSALTQEAANGLKCATGDCSPLHATENSPLLHVAILQYTLQ